MQITQWARPGPCSNRLHHGSTAMARHPGRAMACQTYPPSSSNLKSSSLLLEKYFPKLAVHNGRGSSIQQTECACPCCVLYTHSRAAKRPLAASLPATPALGHRRCLIVFTVFRRAANDPEMFSVADRQEKGYNSALQATPMHSQGSARPHIRCHEKNCNSRIYGGVTHFPHIHQQCRQDTSTTNPRIPPIH